MAGNINQKLKLLQLMKILNEQTDETTTLTINDIIDELNKYGISAERKSLYSDMELLKEFGMDIICKKNRTFNYYVGGRDFELPELKLLVDAVQSSKFITRKKTSELIEKLGKLTSGNLSKQLQRQVFVSDRVKTINETIYYNIDNLYNAISGDKKVAFRYLEYTVDKKKQYRHNGEIYIVSPYGLTWEDDNYYLLSHCPKHEGEITPFRVDKMTDINIINENRKDISEVTGDVEFNTAIHSKQTFSMFSGETGEVKIRFRNKLIDVVIDRFGEDVDICDREEEYFTIRVKIAKSSAFMAWIFKFGEDAKIVSPKDMVDDMKARLDKVVEMYK